MHNLINYVKTLHFNTYRTSTKSQCLQLREIYSIHITHMKICNTNEKKNKSKPFVLLSE